MAELYDEDSGRWVEVHTPYGKVSMTPRRARRYSEEVDAAYEPPAPLTPNMEDDAGQWVGVTSPGVGKVYMTPERATRYADQVDAEHTTMQAEDDALSELAGSMDYAGIGKPAPAPTPAGAPAAVPRPMARRPAMPRADTPADVDALGAAWDDFQGRANPVDVEHVPSTVSLASRMGGESLPGPTQRKAVASPEPGPQQGPVFGESDTLQDAQRRATLMRGLAGIGRGSSRIGAALAGIRPESEGASGLERAGNEQVREYMQRKQQGDAEKATSEQAVLSDPASPASQRFQALVSRAFGSAYTPEQIQQMTAADAPLVGKYGEMIRTLEDRAAGRAAEAESQNTQLAARATEADKQRAFEGKQGALSRANAKEIAGMRTDAATDRAGERAGATTFRNEATLRKELESNPATKAFREVEVSLDKVKRAAQTPSAAGDLSLIFGYMKMLDPGSTVREGEFANAQNAGGVGDKLANTYNKIISGERLTPDQRADFVRQAQAAYEAHRSAYEKVAEQYRGIASSSGIAPERVAIPVGLDLNAPPSDANAQAAEWARAHPDDPRAKQILSVIGG